MKAFFTALTLCAVVAICTVVGTPYEGLIDRWQFLPNPGVGTHVIAMACVEGYSGPLITVRRNTDGATLTINCPMPRSDIVAKLSDFGPKGEN